MLTTAMTRPGEPAMPSTPPTPPVPATPPAPPSRLNRDKIDILWGMLRVSEEEDGDRVDVLWGLLSVKEKKVRVPRRQAAEDAGTDATHSELDPFEAAVRRTDERMSNLQATAILGALAVAFWYLSWASGTANKEFWAGFWGVASVSVGAVGIGLGISVLSEPFRRRWLRREVDAIETQRAAQRALSGQQTAAIQELTASIAHEIRNPITAAKSLVQQMGEDPRAADNIEYASVALEELERVERSVSHLLRFARDEQIELREIDLSDVLESAVAAVRDRAEELGVGMACEIDSRGPISGDAEKLRRVFLNLVGNALDALEQEASPSPHLQVELGENLGGTEVWVRVRDNGPGIEAERMAKIFHPFHTSKTTGTGLGLPICKKIVDQHGGTIDAASRAGEGAEFVLTFPKCAASTVAPA